MCSPQTSTHLLSMCMAAGGAAGEVGKNGKQKRGASSAPARLIPSSAHVHRESVEDVFAVDEVEDVLRVDGEAGVVGHDADAVADVERGAAGHLDPAVLFGE